MCAFIKELRCSLNSVSLKVLSTSGILLLFFLSLLSYELTNVFKDDSENSQSYSQSSLKNLGLDSKNEAIESTNETNQDSQGGTMQASASIETGLSIRDLSLLNIWSIIYLILTWATGIVFSKAAGALFNFKKQVSIIYS